METRPHPQDSRQSRFVSRIHRKKPPRRPMPETMRRANALKSKVRSGVEHVFAVQKDKMDLFIRTARIARARLKIGMANFVYNFRRLVYLDRIAAA
jgi:transposase, IS5 family